MTRLFLYSVLFGLCLGVSLCADPIETDRPDFTEASSVVPMRRVQIESGYTFTKTDSGVEQSIGEWLIRIPFSTWGEYRFELPNYIKSAEKSEWETASLGLKLIPQKDWAIILGSSLTGEPFVKLCSGLDLNESVAFSYNLNAEIATIDEEKRGRYSASGSFSLELTPQWGTYLESYYMSDPSAIFLNAGLTYLVNDDFQLDARIGKDTSIPNNYFLGLGLSARLGY